MKNKYILVVFSLFSLFSCQNSKIDLEKEKQSLMQTDVDFSNLSEKSGMNRAFLEFCSEDAVLLRPNNLPFEGKDAIENELKTKPDTAFKLIWKPLKAIISKSGDLGYTYGTYELYQKDSNKLQSEGTYLTVWKKDENGKWKWCSDTGNHGLKKK